MSLSRNLRTRTLVGSVVVLCVLQARCEYRDSVGLPGHEVTGTEYVDKSTRVNIDSDEWIIYDVIGRHPLVTERLAGPGLACSSYPETLHIEETQATEVTQLGTMWTRVKSSLQARAAADRIGPVSFSVEVGKTQRIATREVWEPYTSRIDAYHFRQDGNRIILVDQITVSGVRFAHLTGWESTNTDCHEQGGG